jgi:hypothetical protein
MDTDAAAPAKRSNMFKQGGVSTSVSANSKSKFNLISKKSRRTISRPLAAKGSKGERLQREAAQEAASKQAKMVSLQNDRIKRLEKLLARHRAAGNEAGAAATEEQIAGIFSEIAAARLEERS